MWRGFQCTGGLLLLLCCGCNVVESVQPLSDKETHVPDDRLAAQWRPVAPADMPDAKPQETFVIRKRDGHYEATSRESDLADLLTTKIGKQRYFSLKARKPATANGTYAIYRYEIAGDELRIYRLEPERVAEAVQREQLAGTITRRPPENPNQPPPVTAVRITSSTAELRELLGTEAGQRLFSKEPAIVLRRAEP
jgi:hypothetical protein